MHPSSKAGGSIIGGAILLTFLATVIICARFWSRHLQRARYGLDDWLNLAALPCFYIQGSMLKTYKGIHKAEPLSYSAILCCLFWRSRISRMAELNGNKPECDQVHDHDTVPL